MGHNRGAQLLHNTLLHVHYAYTRPCEALQRATHGDSLPTVLMLSCSPCVQLWTMSCTGC